MHMDSTQTAYENWIAVRGFIVKAAQKLVENPTDAGALADMKALLVAEKNARIIAEKYVAASQPNAPLFEE